MWLLVSDNEHSLVNMALGKSPGPSGSVPFLLGLRWSSRTSIEVCCYASLLMNLKSQVLSANFHLSQHRTQVCWSGYWCKDSVKLVYSYSEKESPPWIYFNQDKINNRWKDSVKHTHIQKKSHHFEYYTAYGSLGLHVKNCIMCYITPDLRLNGSWPWIKFWGKWSIYFQCILQ